MDGFPFSPMPMPFGEADGLDSYIDSVIGGAMDTALHRETAAVQGINAETTTRTPSESQAQLTSTTTVQKLRTTTLSTTLNSPNDPPVRTASPPGQSSSLNFIEQASTQPTETVTSTQVQIKATTKSPSSLPTLTISTQASFTNSPQSLSQARGLGSRLEFILPIAIIIPILIIAALILAWLWRSRRKKPLYPKQKTSPEPYPIEDMEQRSQSSKSTCTKTSWANTSRSHSAADINTSDAIITQPSDEPNSPARDWNFGARIARFFRRRRRETPLESQIASMKEKIQNLEAALYSAEVATRSVQSPSGSALAISVTTGGENEDQPPDYIWHINQSEPPPTRSIGGKAEYATRNRQAVSISRQLPGVA